MPQRATNFQVILHRLRGLLPPNPTREDENEAFDRMHNLPMDVEIMEIDENIERLSSAEWLLLQKLYHRKDIRLEDYMTVNTKAFLLTMTDPSSKALDKMSEAEQFIEGKNWSMLLEYLKEAQSIHKPLFEVRINGHVVIRDQQKTILSHVASRCSEIEPLEALSDLGALCEARSMPPYRNALFHALENDRPVCVLKYLYSLITNKESGIVHDRLGSILHVACRRRNQKAIQWILDIHPELMRVKSKRDGGRCPLGEYLDGCKYPFGDERHIALKAPDPKSFSCCDNEEEHTSILRILCWRYKRLKGRQPVSPLELCIRRGFPTDVLDMIWSKMDTVFGSKNSSLSILQKPLLCASQRHKDEPCERNGAYLCRLAFYGADFDVKLPNVKHTARDIIGESVYQFVRRFCEHVKQNSLTRFLGVVNTGFFNEE